MTYDVFSRPLLAKIKQADAAALIQFNIGIEG